MIKKYFSKLPFQAVNTQNDTVKIPVSISLINKLRALGFVQVDDKIEPLDQEVFGQERFNLMRINHSFTSNNFDFMSRCQSVYPGPKAGRFHS